MHIVHTPTHAHMQMQSPTKQCAMRTVDRRHRTPLSKALLIGIKVFWWGRLLIRLERHASQMWCLFRPAQGPINNTWPFYLCICVHLCVFAYLSLVITLKTHWHWLVLGPSGSPWPHPDMSSVGGKTRLVVGSELHALALIHIRQNCKIKGLNKGCQNVLLECCCVTDEGILVTWNNYT